ncbi:MAG: transketolase family protein [Chloroflexi bacterium]|nr:transketolase family protein [Chloroflexota bacterium]
MGLRTGGTIKLGLSTREAYGRTLLALGREYPDLVVLDADLAKSTMTKLFADAFPERFFDCGVAEQNMIGLAAGLASCGKLVFASSFAVFVPGRSFDQLRMSVAYSFANVKIASSHAGLTVGEDGASHQAIEDLALMRSLPGFVIVVPADEVATAWATRAAIEHIGPVYLRLGRPKHPLIYDEGDEFTLGKAVMLRDGPDATIVANGRMMAEALLAREILHSKGLSVRVLDLHTVEPLDREALVDAARQTGAVVVAEEHLLSGGTGSAVAQLLAEECPVPMEFVAIRQCYGQSGDPDGLLRKYGLTADDIVIAVEKAVGRKQAGTVHSLVFTAPDKET